MFWRGFKGLLFCLCTVGLTWLANFGGVEIPVRTIILCVTFLFSLILWKSHGIRGYLLWWIGLFMFELLGQVGDFTFFRGISLVVIWICLASWPKALVRDVIDIYILVVKWVMCCSTFFVLAHELGFLETTSAREFWGIEWSSRSALDSLFRRGSDEFVSGLGGLVFGNYQRNPLLTLGITPLGLSYEPHVNMLFCAPAILLNKNRKGFWLSFLAVYAVMVYSLTGILSLGFCAIVANLKNRRLLNLLGLVILGMLFVYVISDTGFFSKLFDGGRSRETSVSYLAHILSPSLYSDYGVLDIPSAMGTSISIFGFIFYSVTYCCLCISVIKFRRAKIHGVLALVYVVGHSLKLPLHVLNYPLLFLIFIYLSDEYNSSKSGVQVGTAL